MDDFVQANRAMWNETADVHADHYLAALLERVKAPDFSTFDEVEKHIFSRLGLTDKAVIQLSCNNGRELISVKKAGAAYCLGVDISDKFIAQAKALQQASGVEVDFLRSDVYELPESLNTRFDLVYVTIGALGWLPDLARYLKIVAALLKPGGQVFIYEMHPMLDMFDASSGLEVKHSYFRTDPYFEESAPDYLDTSKIVAAKSYWFHYKLSDLLGGLLHNGLQLEFFEEYPHDISEVFKSFEAFAKKPPLCYALVAQKRQA